MKQHSQEFWSQVQLKDSRDAQFSPRIAQWGTASLLSPQTQAEILLHQQDSPPFFIKRSSSTNWLLPHSEGLPLVFIDSFTDLVEAHTCSWWNDTLPVFALYQNTPQTVLCSSKSLTEREWISEKHREWIPEKHRVQALLCFAVWLLENLVRLHMFIGDCSGLFIVFKAQLSLQPVQRLWCCQGRMGDGREGRSLPRDRLQKWDDKSKCRIISLMLDYHS